MDNQGREPAVTVEPLEALRELARSAAEDPLERVLESVCDLILSTTGFRTLALNAYRPAWDDYMVVRVGGDDFASELLGTTIPRSDFQLIGRYAEERVPGIFFLTGDSGFWDVARQTYVPDLPESDDPDAWRAQDALVVALREPDGAALGFVSIDEPHSGRRPSDADLRILAVICSYAEQALRNARRAGRVQRERERLAAITEVSARVSESTTREQLHALIAATIAPGLGFERVAVYAAGAPGTLALSVARGWDGQASSALPETLAQDALADALGTTGRIGGWQLTEAARLFGAPPVGRSRSRRNGRGPLGWHDHCLLIGWGDTAQQPAGVVVAEDPIDHALPDDEHCRALRLLTDLAAAVERTIDQRGRLDRLASRDTLTGLHNRRGLDRLADTGQQVALLVCDLDRFKAVNDRYGHEVGDRVLERFGELLRTHTRDGDVPVRLGGDEFCVVLPGADRDEAMEIAERIRTATPAGLAGIVPTTVTVSIGLTVSRGDEPTPQPLLAAADRALYRAKRDGRDRAAAA